MSPEEVALSLACVLEGIVIWRLGRMVLYLLGDTPAAEAYRASRKRERVTSDSDHVGLV